MVYLIYGSPCSGKSTYVQKRLRAGDIVCDVDRLYSAVSHNKEHHSELYAQEVANMLYDEMLNIIRDRRGHWKNAYVICLANTKERVEQMKERIDADEEVFIDTPFEECINRAKGRPFYFPHLIENWFNTGDLYEQSSNREK